MRYVNCDAAPTRRVRQLPVAAAPPVDELEQLHGVCQRLQANPVLHMSLHSKELFHSNFLAWLVEAHPDLGEQVLKPWLESDSTQKALRVRRETHHLDVVIELPGYRPLVIENKVFSLPYKAQLAGYDEVNLPKAGLTGATRILLSLPDPGWVTWEGWTWVSYDVLADRLEPHVSTLTSRDAFSGLLLRHYVSMVRDLLELARLTAATGDGDEVALDADQVELLRPLRLHDVMQKLRARQILLRVEGAYRERATPFTWTEVGMANGSVLMSTALTLDNRDQLGWQLQGAQWRRFLITATEGKGEQAKADRASYATARYSSWFDFTTEQELGHFVEMPKVGFNHFDPSFVYRYLKVPALKVGELLAMSVQVAEQAASYEPLSKQLEQVDEVT